MRVIIALVVLAVSLSLVGCSYRNPAAYAKPLPSVHPTKAPTKAIAERSRQAGEVSAKGDRTRIDKVKGAVVTAPEEHRISKRTVERALAKGEPEVGTEAKPQPPAAVRVLPTTIDTVRGVANALTFRNTDQAVSTAKAFIDNLKVKVSIYYRSLAADRLPSEQTEAAINQVPSVDLFDRPEQGIAKLKVLRQGVEKELAIDETDAKDNKFAEARQKANERALNARRLIGTIGTDEDLDHALGYLDTLRTEAQWPDFVKMLTGSVEQEAEVKFKAAQAKAKKLGGPQNLTREDIDGLSSEQIKQLRGY
jgi:hypothetical protein